MNPSAAATFAQAVPALGRSLLGYAPHAVAAALLTMRENHRREINELSDALAAEQARQAALQAKIDWIVSQTEAAQQVASRLQAMQEEAEQAAPFIDVLLRWDAAEVAAQAAAEREALLAGCAQLEREIDEERELLRHGLKQFADIAARLSIPGPEGDTPAGQTGTSALRPRSVFWLSAANGTANSEEHLDWRPGLVGQAEATAAVPPAAPAAVTATGAAPAVNRAGDLLGLLAGKVVGRDLSDPSGRLLARRGDPITAALVEQAETVGLLPTLILEMTWPEAGP